MPVLELSGLRGIRRGRGADLVSPETAASRSAETGTEVKALMATHGTAATPVHKCVEHGA